MQRAIELAKKGEGWTNPNPMVGAVIVKDGRIIGEGYHEKWGELHAERNAIRSLKESAEGATMYVTLEPCCHHGKTPPCTEAIIEQKIAQVVVGSRDPNPLVAGKGVQILRKAGIEVIEDFMREDCDRINPIFFHYITTRTPYVVLKYAMTADGKIATRIGASKWITGEAARQEVQKMRRRYMGIMAGIGTVLADDPMLNVRISGGRSPVRIICDSALRIPADSRIVKTADRYRTIVAATERGSSDPADRGDVLHDKNGKRSALEAARVEVLEVPSRDGEVDLQELLVRLGGMGIDSVMVEGGGTLNDSLLRAGLVQEVQVFMAPKIFGGRQSKTPVEGCGVDLPGEAVEMELMECRQIEEDLLVRYTIKRKITQVGR